MTGNIAVASYGNKKVKVLLYGAGFKYLRTVVDFAPPHPLQKILQWAGYLTGKVNIASHEDCTANVMHKCKVSLQEFDLWGKGNFNFHVILPKAKWQEILQWQVTVIKKVKVLLYDAGYKNLRTVVVFFFPPPPPQKKKKKKRKPRCVAFSKGCILIAVSKGSSKQAKSLSKVSVYTTDGKFAKHISEHLVNPYSVSVRSDVFVFLFPL